MEPGGDQKHEEAQKRLLEEGARSYLDAVSALIAYRQEVQKMCRTVLEKHLDDYSSAIKVRLETREIRDFASPSFAKWETTGGLWALRLNGKKLRPRFVGGERIAALRANPAMPVYTVGSANGFPQDRKLSDYFRDFTH